MINVKVKLAIHVATGQMQIFIPGELIWNEFGQDVWLNNHFSIILKGKENWREDN